MNITEILAKIAEPPFPAVVVAAFAIIFIVYVYITKAINGKNSVSDKPQAPTVTTASKAAPVQASGPAASSGDLELVGVDEKTAAVIMAIVSNKSGIPLNRLQFKSITLMEDK